MQRFIDLRRRAVLAFALTAAADFALPSQLPRLMNCFAESWNAFVLQANKGVFDAKLAKKITKAWHALENSEEWPRG